MACQQRAKFTLYWPAVITSGYVLVDGIVTHVSQKLPIFLYGQLPLNVSLVNALQTYKLTFHIRRGRWWWRPGLFDCHGGHFHRTLTDRHSFPFFLGRSRLFVGRSSNSIVHSCLSSVADYDRWKWQRDRHFSLSKRVPWEFSPGCHQIKYWLDSNRENR